MTENTKNTIKAARNYFGTREFTEFEWDYTFTYYYRHNYDRNPASVRTVRRYENIEYHEEFMNLSDECEDYGEWIRFYHFA